jgi:hypothetical protein
MLGKEWATVLPSPVDSTAIQSRDVVVPFLQGHPDTVTTVDPPEFGALVNRLKVDKEKSDDECEVAYALSVALEQDIIVCRDAVSNVGFEALELEGLGAVAFTTDLLKNLIGRTRGLAVSSSTLTDTRTLLSILASLVPVPDVPQW